MSEQNKDKKGPGQGKSKRPHSKNYKGNKGQNRGPNKGPKPSGNKNAAGNSTGGPKKRSNSKNRRPKSMTPARVLQKYDNLLEQYLIARKKYFEMKGKVSGKQLQKVENNWQKTVKALREYEINTTGWQKETLAQRVNFFPEDRTYTTNNEIEPIGDEVALTGDFLDEHYLATQLAAAAQYKEDTEESTGSIDDYKAYKGITE